MRIRNGFSPAANMAFVVRREHGAAVLFGSVSDDQVRNLISTGYLSLESAGRRRHTMLCRFFRLRRRRHIIGVGVAAAGEITERAVRAPRARTSRRFERYSVNPAFPYDYCYCIY
jgi:hypothetical protein